MLQIAPEVKQALAEARPVVALESTIIAHGMPYPENLIMAKEVEAIIREEGATPATIAVLSGLPQIGMNAEDLALLAQKGAQVMKLSSKDLPFAVAMGLHGATTVAATMRLAALAGIEIFATGGIGGVHRGAEKTFDISADITELSRTPVAVVTAGAKAILDLGLTLEVLETNNVPVVGYQTDEFPAFYSRSSGHRLNLHVESAEQMAAFMQAKWQLEGEGGIVIANPIPIAHEISAQEIEPALNQALAEAEAQKICGKNLTPFLLKKIAEVTQGRSLTANIALVKHNARQAAKIAKAYNKRLHQL